jgi:hypothetical protein
MPVSKRKMSLVMLERLSYTALMQNKNKAAQALGRLGGLKGGKARAAKLSSEERKAIASKAAQKRWASKSK